MSTLETFRVVPPGRKPRTEIVGAYEAARRKALALAPVVRAERATVDLIPAVEDRPRLPPAARALTRMAILLVCAGAAWRVAPEPLALICGLALGVAMAAAGDALGAALRGFGARDEWRGRLCLACTVLSHAAQAGMLAVAAGILARSLLAAGGLALLGLIAVTVGHATRVGDAEFEARANVRRAARRQLAAAEHAVRRTVAALRAAHAADLARIATELDCPVSEVREGGSARAAGSAAMAPDASAAGAPSVPAPLAEQIHDD
jgi:hypothetical protein